MFLTSADAWMGRVVRAELDVEIFHLTSQYMLRLINLYLVDVYSVRAIPFDNPSSLPSTPEAGRFILRLPFIEAPCVISEAIKSC